MADRSQNVNMLIAFFSLAAVIIIVTLIGFYTLGKGPEVIQGQAEADEYRVSARYLHAYLNSAFMKVTK